MNLTLFNTFFILTRVFNRSQASDCQPNANSLISAGLTAYISETHLDAAKNFRIFAFWKKVHGS